MGLISNVIQCFALPPWASPSTVEDAGIPIMSLVTLQSTSATSHLLWANHILQGGKLSGSLYDVKKQNPFLYSERDVRASARRRKNLFVRKLSNDERSRERAALRIHESSSDQRKELVDGSSAEDDYLRVQEGSTKDPVDVPSRSAVLQACIFTSALIGLLGVTIRQLSHVASVEGLPIHDCSMEVQFGFEMWHLELITGLVVLISSSRYLLLRIWPDFAESTEAANQQVLTSLQPLDYIVVAFLPGVGEELLFRGALLPLFGINVVSISVVAAIFGALHLGSGRKYSFAIWATFVGFVYGYATVLSSSIVVPMASHVLNNLVGGILWHYSLKSNQVDVE